MGESVKIVGKVLLTEARLAWRRPSFWALQGLILILIAPIWLRVPGQFNGLQFVSYAIGQTLAFELMILPVLVGPAFARDFRESGDVVWTTSADGLWHGVGVAAGLWLALLPALVAQIGARWALISLKAGAASLLMWTYGLPVVIMSVTLGLGLVALLTVVVRRTLLLIMLWGGLWALLTYAYFQTVTQETSLTSRLLFTVIFSAIDLSAALGPGLYGSLIWNLALTLFGVSTLLVLLALGLAVLVDQRRSMRSLMPYALLLLLGISIIGGGSRLYASTLATQQTPDSRRVIQLDLWAVQEQTLDATVDWAARTVAGTSTLVLQATQPLTTSELVLRLNQGMRVSEVTTAAGQSLATQRIGDSIVVTLPDAPTQPLTLRLAWSGTPRLAYTDYAPHANYSPQDQFYAPQPVRALLRPEAGYLLRDGDWYPWPWTTGPQQATRNAVTLRSVEQRTVASAAMRAGVAQWEGAVPYALLVLPPNRSEQQGSMTIHLGTAADQQLVTRMRSFAQNVPILWRSLGEAQPPTQIIALPYLNDFIWSGSLFLVPEGSGFLHWDQSELAYQAGSSAAVEARAALMGLARGWLSPYMTLPRAWVWAGANADDEEHGRWIEPLDFGQWRLSPAERLHTLALWIAIEQAAPEVRDADLTLFQQQLEQAAASDPQSFWNQDVGTYRSRLLSLDSSGEKGAAILALHNWAATVGLERALTLVGDEVRSGPPLDFEQIFANLERTSGVPLVEPWRALQP